MNRILPRLPLALLLLLAAPVRGDEVNVSSNETSIIDRHKGYALEVRCRGRVEFNDEGDWVIDMDPDAFLSILEEKNGRRQRLEFERDGGEILVHYRVDGRDRPLDASGREWARQLLRSATRESGLGAEARVARIRNRSGVSGVLADMSDLKTDTGRRFYYLALLGSGPMSANDFALVMNDVAKHMDSGSERRLVLVDAAQRAAAGPGLTALLGAAMGMGSDTETRLVLVEVLAHHSLADAGTRGAFFRAVGGIDGDTERRLVLVEALGKDGPEPVVLDVLASAAGMESDTEKRLVLTSIPARSRNSSQVLAAYRRVVDGIGSDTERRLALTWLLNPER